MKKTILLLMLCCFLPVFSQTYEVTQVPFTILGKSNYYISPDSSYFKQNNFILGWHWGGSKKITKALLCNQNDAANNDDLDSKHTPTYLFVKMHDEQWNYIYTHGPGPDIMNARGITYEPTLSISGDPLKFTPRVGDTTNPIFGFKHIAGSIQSNPSDPNFNRLIVDNTVQDSIILDDPWDAGQLFFFRYDDKLPTALFYEYSGRAFNFVINLRRFDKNDMSIFPLSFSK